MPGSSFLLQPTVSTCTSALFNGTERANLVASVHNDQLTFEESTEACFKPGTYDSKDRSSQQDPKAVTQPKRDATGDHKRCPRRQDESPTNPIGARSEKQADASIANKRQCHEQPNSRGREAQQFEVCDQMQGRRAVREHADKALETYQLDVLVTPAKTLQATFGKAAGKELAEHLLDDGQRV